MKEIKLTNGQIVNKEGIADMLAAYVTDSYIDFELFGEKEDDVRAIFGDYQQEYDNYEADEDGLTAEQVQELRTMELNHAAEILELF